MPEDQDKSSTARFRLSKGSIICGYPAASLRTEARRGNLVLIRIAGKDYVTEQSIRDMEIKCRIAKDTVPALATVPSARDEQAVATSNKVAQEALRLLIEKMTKPQKTH